MLHWSYTLFDVVGASHMRWLANELKYSLYCDPNVFPHVVLITQGWSVLQYIWVLIVPSTLLLFTKKKNICVVANMGECCELTINTTECRYERIILHFVGALILRVKWFGLRVAWCKFELSQISPWLRACTHGKHQSHILFYFVPLSTLHWWQFIYHLSFSVIKFDSPSGNR